MGADCLIVDAHSMIFALPRLRALHGRRMVLARDALVRELVDYADFTGHRVAVVFDGRGAKASEEKEGSVVVFYAPSHKTADDLVERLAAKYARDSRVVVATEDALERQTVVSFGAECVDAGGFESLLREARARFLRDQRGHLRGG